MSGSIFSKELCAGLHNHESEISLVPSFWWASSFIVGSLMSGQVDLHNISFNVLQP